MYPLFPVETSMDQAHQGEPAGQFLQIDYTAYISFKAVWQEC